jgi:hypothetical protein
MTIFEIMEKNAHDRRNIEHYDVLWNGSEEWVLLERNEPILSSGKKLYWPYNLSNPKDEVPELILVKALEKMEKENVRIFSLKESLEDPLRDYCWKSGCSYRLITNNAFEVLVKDWNFFIKLVLDVEYFDFFEYLNYLDSRKLLSELFEMFKAPNSIIEETKKNDNKLHSFLKPFPEGLLGEQLSKSIDREKYWYYFSIPPSVSLDWIDSPSSVMDFYEMLSGKSNNDSKQNK